MKLNIVFVLLGFFFLAACQSSHTNALSSTAKPIDVKMALQKGSFKLVRDASQIKIMTIKNGDTPVAGRLNFIAGNLNLTQAPGLDLEVDLTSWDSGLTIRDQRVVTILFKMLKSAYVVSPVLEAAQLEGLRASQSIEALSVISELKIGEVTRPLPAQLKVSFSQKGRLVVDSLQKIKVNISDLGLSENLKTLLDVCAHKSVADTVEMDVHLEFSPN